MLPEPILLEAQAELLDWQGSGMSILEVNHRSDAFQSLLLQAEADIRELLRIPDYYHVLFLGGAARTQFAMVPMNFLSPEAYAGYLVSGIWSSLAYEEACKLKHAYCVASSQADGFNKTPDPASWTLRDSTQYVYFTPNETINGVRFTQVPEVGSTPLVVDMTSCLLSEPIEIDKFALIFAGAQKNISTAGLTLVIVRDDLLEQLPEPVIPTMMDYRTQVAHRSLYATPPVFNCYLAATMFRWVKQQGGVEALYAVNCQKAARLYQYLDDSSFYTCAIEKNSRSLMNVCFFLNNQSLEKDFLMRAQERGLVGLKGHRLVGGLRASLYNAMPMAGVDALIAFMQEFAKEHHV